MSTCLSCTHWTGAGVPRWAFKLGMACCDLKNTKAVTMARWAACGRYSAADAGVVAARVLWLGSVDNKGA